MGRGPAAGTKNAPPVAAWQALHHRCDPQPGSSHYVIESERIVTPADLADWAEHLAGKYWITGTDWYSAQPAWRAA